MSVTLINQSPSSSSYGDSTSAASVDDEAGAIAVAAGDDTIRELEASSSSLEVTVTVPPTDTPPPSSSPPSSMSISLINNGPARSPPLNNNVQVDALPNSQTISNITPSTPLRWQMFASMLCSHPDQSFVTQLVSDLRFGVRVGYSGPRDKFRPSPNLPIDSAHESFVDEEMKKEVELGRRMGPFVSPPFPNLIVSPIGVVTKKLSTKLRVIHHLSWPRIARTSDSINTHISEKDSKTTLQSFDDAITILCQLHSNANVNVKTTTIATTTAPNSVLLSKIDVKSAYRLVPIHPDDWHLLGIHWKEKYYYDKCLPFGLASSCQLWERVATAVHWIISHRLGITTMVHYIDDYLLISANNKLAATQLKYVIKVFTLLGVPLALDKLEGPCTKLTFLGISIDTASATVSLDDPRFDHVCATLTDWNHRKAASIQQLQSLVGTLNFCSRVIRAGRLFLRRIFHYISHLHHRTKSTTTLQPLPQSVKLDIQWWIKYLPTTNGTCPIYPLTWCTDSDMYIATDACQLGYGGVFGSHWFHGKWNEQEEVEAKRDARDSMPFKELHTLVRAAATWGKCWSQRNIIFHLDCQPMVFAIAHGGSKHPAIMHLLRTLSFIAAQNNFQYKVRHIAGLINVGPDLLSRDCIADFQSQFPNCDRYPTPTCPLPCHDW